MIRKFAKIINIHVYRTFYVIVDTFAILQQMEKSTFWMRDSERKYDNLNRKA